MSPLQVKLISQRWQLGEFIFIDYVRGASLSVDIGPFPEDPSNEQTAEALKTLADAQLPWLDLGEESWILDFDALLSAEIPGLNLEEEARGKRQHPPAFEWSSMQEMGTKQIYLQIPFSISESQVPVLDESADPETVQVTTSARPPRDSITCWKCGAKNLGDSNYCDQCSADLNEAGVPLKRAPSVPPAPSRSGEAWSPAPEEKSWGGAPLFFVLVLVVLFLMFGRTFFQ